MDHQLVERVRSRLAAEGGAPTPARVASALREESGLHGDAEVLEVLRGLRALADRKNRVVATQVLRVALHDLKLGDLVDLQAAAAAFTLPETAPVYVDDGYLCIDVTTPKGPPWT